MAEVYKYLLIGEDNLVLECANILLCLEHHILAIVAPNVQGKSWAKDRGIQYFDSLIDIENKIDLSDCDYLFSIVNASIIPNSVLSKIRRHAINYHDAFLPTYAGVHAVPWAIINNEKKHGITWHLMNDAIDTGDIIYQSLLDITPNDTTVSLSLKCYQEALISFSALVQTLMNDSFTLVKQNLHQRTYFSRNKKPLANGVINWFSDAESIERMCRALDFGSYSNQFSLPKILVENHVFFVKIVQIETIKTAAQPGTIIAVDSNKLTVTTSTYDLSIKEVYDTSGKRLSVEKLSLEMGSKLPVISIQSAINFLELSEKYFVYEQFWLQKFSRVNQITLPFLDVSDNTVSHAACFFHINIDKQICSTLKEKYPDKSLAILLFSAIVILIHKLTDYSFNAVKFKSTQMISSIFEIDCLFNSYVPIVFNILPNDSYITIVNHFIATLELCKDKRFSSDIFLRYGLESENDYFPVSCNVVENIDTWKVSPNDLLSFVIDEHEQLYLFIDEKQPLKWSLNYTENMFCEHLNDVLKLICFHESQALSEHVLFDSPVYHPMTPATPTVIPTIKSIIELFEKQVEQTPHHIALSYEFKEMNYYDLNSKVNRLARYLMTLGVNSENFVVIGVKRSFDLIISLLAVLKTGAAYVPLDLSNPQKRIQHIINDSQAKFLITETIYGDRFAEFPGKVVLLDDVESEINEQSNENLKIKIPSHHLAYVIYTSGSTGYPKGVMIEHGNFINYLLWCKKTYLVDGYGKVLLHASVAFDMAVTSIYLPLISGDEIVLLPESSDIDLLLIELKKTDTYKFLKLTPAHLHALRVSLSPQQLKDKTSMLIIGGENLYAKDIEFWQAADPLVTIYNEYGPTEATVGCCVYKLNDQDRLQGSIPIGHAIDNTQLYVLDSKGKPLPVGIEGELYIGGLSVARGYLNQSNLTQEKFVQHPFITDTKARLYKTGDKVCYNADGTLQYLGRTDDQIKIRGYRIEIGEIEAALNAHDDIYQVVVVAAKDDLLKLHIIAYIVSGEFKPNVTELRQYLTNRLPEYMIPAQFIFLNHMPLTANGKVDRQSLPKASLDEHTIKFVPATSNFEKKLSEVWCDLFKLEKISITTNFFQIGGDSIVSLQLVSKAREKNIILELNQIFKFPTIAEQAAIAKEGNISKTIQMKENLHTNEFLLSPIQHWFFGQAFVDLNYFNQSIVLKTYTKIRVDLFEQSLVLLLRKHDALRLRFIQKEGQWRQRVMTFEETIVQQTPMCHVITIKEHESSDLMQKHCDHFHKKFNIQHGPVIKAIVFNLEQDNTQSIVLMAHHLSVDGVSWRIIMQDLETIYGALVANKAMVFHEEGTSFQTWMTELEHYALSNEIQEEREHWQHTLRQVATCSLDSDVQNITYAASKTVCVSLERHDTQLLLQKIHQAYHTQINDILLSALYLTLSRWKQSNSIALMLEGHGREMIGKNIDLTRTVGWFTTLYPVYLEVDFDDSIPTEHSIKNIITSVKEQLRSIPKRGIGFGILQYLTSKETLSLQMAKVPNICFNYMGQWEPAKYSENTFSINSHIDNHVSSKNELPFQMTINCQILDGVMQIDWLYNPVSYQEDVVSQLAKNLLIDLKAVINHCLSIRQFVHTSSDFPLSLLNQYTFEKVFNDATHIEDLYPLSPMQEGLLFHALSHPASDSYFEQNIYSIESNVFDYDLFRQSWNLVANHHTCLRSGIVWEHLSKPLQYILRAVDVPWTFCDFSTSSVHERQKILNEFLIQDRALGFDFSAPPYFRITILKYSATGFYLVWSHHHIIIDGWSVGLIVEQVLASYAQLCQGETPYLAYVPPYREFIHLLSSRNQGFIREFWQKKMNAVQVANRLSDYPLLFSKKSITESDIQMITSDRHNEFIARDYGVFHSRLSKQVTDDLKYFADKNKLTLNTVIQGAWSIVLSQYLDSLNIVYGITFAGRHSALPQIEKIPGLFINTLPLIQELNPIESLLSYLHFLQKHILELMQHDEISLAEIQAMAPYSKGVPLFDCIVAFENFPSFEQYNDKHFQFKYISVIERTEYPLTINIFPQDEIDIRYGFQTSSFDHAGIEKLDAYLRHILHQMMKCPESMIKDFSVLTPEDTILQQQYWATETFPKNKTIPALFQEQAIKNPDAIALKYESDQLSYYELETKSNQLAVYLQNKGVKRGLIVAVCLEPSIQQIVSLLAIMKAGAAYLPLDPAYPKDRLKFMLEDAVVDHLVLIEKHCELFGDYYDGTMVVLDIDNQSIEKESPQALSLYHSEHDIAYIIYTSGSTGVPKGVCIPHTNIHRLITSTQKWFCFDKTDVWVLFHSYSFDFSVWEIWGALLTGGTLIIAPFFISRSVADFNQLLETEKVTVLNQTPSAFSQLLSYQKHSSQRHHFYLRVVIFGGESLNAYMLKDWYDVYPDSKIRFINMYGITETTVHVTYYSLDPSNLSSRNIVGEKIPDLKLYILNKDQKICPIGVVGELYVGGAGVALGYLNRPELTKQKFIQNPFSSNGEILYRTGDKARFRPDGKVEYWGRLDEQVKIRGYRIELGEIESILMKHTDITQSAVFVEDMSAGQQNLIAYCVAPKLINASKTIATTFNVELRQFLAQYLPSFMIPSAIVLVDKIPLTLNGKIDRNILSQLKNAYRLTNVEYIAPATEMEKNIALIWSELLNLDRIGTGDSFFELGGHSLLAMQLLMKLNSFFNINIKMRELFAAPTISDCVFLVTSYQNNALSKATNHYELPLIQEDIKARYEPFSLTDIQQAYWMGRNGFYELGQVAVQTYHEYDFLELNIDVLEQSWNKLIQRHESLRLVFREEGTQQILNDVPYYKFCLFDLRAASEKSVEKELIHIRNELSHKMLPSEQWPLFSIHVSILPNKIRLHTAFDALILDAWSLRIILKEWSLLYEDVHKKLNTLTVSFRDYVNTEDVIKKNVLYQRDKHYWCDRIATLPLAPKLPLNIQPKDLVKQVFLRRSKCLPKQQWQLIEACLKEHKLSASVLLAGLFADVLSVWSNSYHFTLNLTLFNRLPLHPDINKITGDFSSILLLEFNIDTSISFLNRIKNVQSQLFQDLDYRLFSGVEVLRELNKHNSGSGLVYMPIVFTCTIGRDEQDEDLFLSEQFFSNEIFSITQTSQVWLDYKTYLHSNGDLVIEWDYIADLFPAGMIDDMHQAYYDFLQELANNPTAWFDRGIALLPKRQTENYQTFNQTSWTAEPGLLQELFHLQAKTCLEKIAVIDDRQSITYGDLQNRSYQLGRYLLSLDVKPNQLIAVIMHKCMEQVIALLGILNAGSAYLPIDPDAPVDRIQALLHEAGAVIVLTQWEWVPKLKEIQNKTLIQAILPLNKKEIFDLSDISMAPFPAQQTIHDLAYVIFTSGSTGIPKGVMIDHAAVVNTIVDINNRFKVTSTDSVLSLSNLNFDLSVYDIFGLLMAGGTVVLPGQNVLKNPEIWLKLIEQHDVTIWNTVPMFMQMLMECVTTRIKSKLRLVLLSGDWIPLDLPKHIKQKISMETHPLDVISLGGATEASIWSVIYPIKDISPAWKSIPYGTPLRNQTLYILNDAYQLCPEWVPGNLYIGGDGLAKGYWNNPDKTNGSFMLNPNNGQRLYKTGDYARYAPYGYIEFLGRNDSQIKKDGHRIELGEIESILKAHSQIQHAIVEKVGEAHKSQLVAYIKIGHHQNYNSMISDEALRLEFKLSRHGLRRFSKDHPTVFLSSEHEITEDIIAKYYQRKSYRAFNGKGLTYLRFYNWMETAFQNRSKENAKIDPNKSFKELLHDVLTPLFSIKTEHLPLPKYQYPSAGSLYPVQLYLEIIANPQHDLVSGFYYYDSSAHHLKYIAAIDNEKNSLVQTTVVNLYFIAKLAAISPLYNDLSESFCAIETGYMLSLLAGTWSPYRFKLPTDQYNDQCDLNHVLDLSDTDKLIQKISLCFDTAENTPSLFHQLYDAAPISVYVNIKNDMQGFAIGWYEYDLFDKKLSRLPLLDSFSIVSEKDELFTISDSASFILLFLAPKVNTETKKMMAHLQAGMLSECLMLLGVNSQIGVCPIGNLSSESLMSLSRLMEGKVFIHGLFGGAISVEQIHERGNSNAKVDVLSTEAIKAYASLRLPNYMVPNHFIILKDIPLSANGKVDRSMLPRIETQLNVKPLAPPKSIIEKHIAQLWKEVLQLNEVNINDDFFELGGNSLTVIQVMMRLKKHYNVELSLRDMFEYPTIHQFAIKLTEQLYARNTNALPSIVSVPFTGEAPASFQQKRLWFMEKLADRFALYNIPIALQFEGALNQAHLQRAINTITQRHRIFLTNYIDRDGDLLQVVRSSKNFSIVVIDEPKETIVSEEAHYEKTITAIKLLAKQPFDLECDNLIRFYILKLSESKFIFLSVVHHIIVDGWSVDIFINDLRELYNAYSQQRKENLPELAVQYHDYAIWQGLWMREGMLNKQLDYWTNQLQDVAEVLNLPVEYNRPKELNYAGATYNVHLNKKIVDDLKYLGERNHTSLFSVLLTAFNLLLYKYTNQQDVVIGTPVSGRKNVEIEHLVGFFVNTLVIRTFHEEGLTFNELLSKVNQTVFDAYENQDVPFEQIVDSLHVSRDLSRNPIFQTWFVLHHWNDRKMDFSGLQSTLTQVDTDVAKFDIALLATELEDGLQLSFEYATGLFSPTFIADFSLHFHQLLLSILEDSTCDIQHLSMLTKKDKKLLSTWSMSKKISYDTEIVAQELFESQARQYPKSLAIQDGLIVMTYDELNIKANQLAHYLRKQGVNKNTLVAIYLDQKADFVIAILAVLKAGGAYLPLDPIYPDARLKYMIEDATPPFLITMSTLERKYTYEGHVVSIDVAKTEIEGCLSQNLSVLNANSDLAYIIYTSGSSGKPKGVLINHKNMVSSLRSRMEYYKDPVQHFMLLSSVAFDSSVAGIFWTLFTGGCLHLSHVTGDADVERIAEQLLDKKISHILCIPSLYSLILERLPGDKEIYLKTVIVAGERCNEPLVMRHQSIAPNSDLFNEYGPTEATVWSSVKHVYDASTKKNNGVNIGSPIPNTALYILDQALQLVPMGVEGELYIAGPGISNGYLNQTQLTKDRFIQNPFHSDDDYQTMYKSGDRVKYLSNGEIQFLGRMDDQVKIRGYRIELGEIEFVLNSHQDIKQAIVMKHENDFIASLIAYVVCSEFMLSDTEVKQYLAKKLPAYMIPSMIIFLEKFPMTPNGKLDTKALPGLDVIEHSKTLIAPVTEIEKQLAIIWSELLGKENISILDNFFNIGGDSLLATRVVLLIRTQIKKNISLLRLFEYPVLQDLAAYIDASQESPVSLYPNIKRRHLSDVQETLN